MSNLSGGPAEKAGMTYEALWGVHAMLELFHERAERIRVEEPRIDGAEFWIERAAEHEYWQVKRQLLSQKVWSLTALNGQGVLPFFLGQLRSGHRCIFASITDAPELRTLAERARDAQRFEEFTEKFLAEKKWRAQFDELRRYWENASEAHAFEFLRGLGVRSSDEHTLAQDLCHVLRVMFDGPARTTLDCLRTLYQDSVHQVLTAKSIREHLRTRGIHARAIPIEAGVLQRLKSATETYIAGQRTKLIRGQIISRATAREIIDSVAKSNIAHDVLARCKTLRDQIAATTQKLQASTTDAETQKLHGVLTGYNAELATVDHEIDNAAAQVVAQDAENRADRERQEQARREERQAQMQESLQQYGQVFRLETTPPSFPDNR